MESKRWKEHRASARQMFLWLDRLAPARTKAGRRRLRLLACGTTRLWWDDLTDDAMRRAVEVAELFADDVVGKSELQAAHQAAYTHYHDRTASHRNERRTQRGAYLAFVCCEDKVVSAASAATSAYPVDEEQTPAQVRSEELICDLFRCVFADPFDQTPSFSKKWRSETVTALAAGIYEARAFDRLPILADALEEAGCDDPNMLDHLRGPGPHCRGCWVLDLALGK